MTDATVGRWVTVDPGKVVKSSSEAGGLQVLPSPYDVPVAVRINEGDPTDPSYAVEVRYLGGSEERTRKGQSVADVDVEVGRSSGRIYRVLIDAKLAKSSGRTHLDEVAKAVNALNAQPKGNAGMVSAAVLLLEKELVKQLNDLGRMVHF